LWRCEQYPCKLYQRQPLFHRSNARDSVSAVITRVIVSSRNVIRVINFTQFRKTDAGDVRLVKHYNVLASSRNISDHDSIIFRDLLQRLDARSSPKSYVSLIAVLTYLNLEKLEKKLLVLSRFHPPIGKALMPARCYFKARSTNRDIVPAAGASRRSRNVAATRSPPPKKSQTRIRRRLFPTAMSASRQDIRSLSADGRAAKVEPCERARERARGRASSRWRFRCCGLPVAGSAKEGILKSGAKTPRRASGGDGGRSAPRGSPALVARAAAARARRGSLVPQRRRRAVLAGARGRDPRAAHAAGVRRCRCWVHQRRANGFCNAPALRRGSTRGSIATPIAI